MTLRANAPHANEPQAPARGPLVRDSYLALAFAGIPSRAPPRAPSSPQRGWGTDYTRAPRVTLVACPPVVFQDRPREWKDPSSLPHHLVAQRTPAYAEGVNTAGATSETTRWTGRVGIACLLLVATFLRFHRIDARELWFDENCTFYIVHHLPAWPIDGPPFFQEVGHIPYFALLHLWTHLTTESIFGLRSFSAIAGILTVLAVARLGTSLGGRTVGSIAGLLIAVQPVHIYYSQEARSYAMWMLLITLALHALCRAANDPRRRWWAAYVALAYFAFLTHYYALLWLPGTAAVAMIAHDRRRFWRSWFVANGLLVAACIPVIWLLVIPLSQHGARPWFHHMWQGYPPSLVIPKSLWMMLPSGGYAETCPRLVAATSAFSAPWRTVLEPLLLWGPLILAIGLLATGLLFVDRLVVPSTPLPPWERGEGFAIPPLPPRERGRGEGSSNGLAAKTGGPDRPTARRASAMFIAIALAFLVAAFLNSALLEPTYIVGRYDQAAFPAVILALAFLIDAAARAGTRRSATRAFICGICTLALCACSGLVLLGVDRLPLENRHRALAKQIAAAVGPNDLLISVNKYVLYVLREFQELQFSAEIVSFPPEHDQQLCWMDCADELANPKRIEEGVNTTVLRIQDAMEKGRRVWVIAHGAPAGPRWEIDRRLFAALREINIDARSTDHEEELGLAELVRPR